VPEEDTRPVLHFQGNLEEACNGDGSTDVLPAPLGCNGPFLMEKSELSAAPAASWKVPDPLVDGTAPRNVWDPNWVWRPEAPATLTGTMTIEFWASCGLCSESVGIPADWVVQLFADNVKVADQRVTATPANANLASKLTIDVSVPTTTAAEWVLRIDPVYIDSQVDTRIYYDSASPCPTSLSADPCDSIVRIPVPQPGAAPPAPSGVRVTDVHDGLRIAWEPVAGAASYEVYRSTQPTFAPGKQTRVAMTAGTSHTDMSAQTLTTYYYRVAAVAADGTKGAASLLAYGTPTKFDRQVKVRVDRPYGPQYWEYAGADNPLFTKWSYVGANPVAARSFTQGIGSAKAGPPAPSPGGGGGGPVSGSEPQSSPSGPSGAGEGGGGGEPVSGSEPQSPPVGGVAGVQTVRTKHTVRGKGALKRARFAIDLRKKLGTKLLFRDLARGLRFAETRVTSVRFRGRTATLRGVGLVNGKRVRYVMVVVDRGTGRRDTFRIRLSNGYERHGRLVFGNVLVR
jgi:hypothetical protein